MKGIQVLIVIGGSMRNTRHKLDADDLYFVGVYMILAVILLSILFSACSKGPDGLPGRSPIILTQPASYYQCPNGGTQVSIDQAITVICNGLVGNTGPQGNQGDPGVDINPNPIKVVTFCPGVTTYPSAFLEVGLVISGRLYGVYSQNGGFLTELPPGNYLSNAVGSACNFTVNPDLSITN